MKTKHILRILALTFLVTALGLGCKGTLEKGGAYNPGITNIDGTVTYKTDRALYTADSIFWATYSTLTDVFAIERKNRDLLWKVSPEIKHTMDKVRVQATVVVTAYGRARATYIANPGPTTLTNLNDWVNKLTSLAAVAEAALSPATTNILENPNP